MAGVEIYHNHAKHRFEAGAEPYLAMLNYQVKGKTVDIIHTEVPEQFQGQGVAGALARSALEWARQAGLKVLPSCPYVKGYIEKHPEFADLL